MAIKDNPERKLASHDRAITDIAEQCNVQKDAIQDAYPCTPFQTDCMAAAIAVPGAFVSHFTFDLDSNVQRNLEAFKKALEWAHERNPILRTRLVKLEDRNGPQKVRQVVLREPVEWVVVEDVHDWKKSRIESPVVYGQRLAHYVLNKAGDTFVWTLHHPLYDAWTMSLIWEDIRSAYMMETKASGAGSRPPYSNFISYLLKQPSPASEAFWNEQLGGYQGPLQRTQALDPSDPSIWPETDFRKSGKEELLWKLDSSCTPASRLRFSWICALMVHFGTRDVLFQNLSTGRNCPIPGIDEMTGPTITQLPFRACFQPAESASKVMEEVDRRFQSMLEHEHGAAKSFEKYVYDLCKPRHMFNAVDGKQADAAQNNPMPGVTFAPETKLIIRSPYDWGISLEIHDWGIKWRFWTDSRKLSAADGEHIVDLFLAFSRESGNIDRSKSLDLFLESIS